MGCWQRLRERVRGQQTAPPSGEVTGPRKTKEGQSDFLTDGPDAGYELRYSKKWTDELCADGAYWTHVDGDTIAIWSNCPRCTHQLSDVVFLDKANEKTNYTVEGVVLSCNCQSKHDGRAEGVAGCGAYGGVSVVVEDGAKGEVKLKAALATNEDRRWDELAYKAGTDALAGSKDLATKWSATVATLLSILGVATIVGLFDELLKLPMALRVFTAVLTLGAITAATFATYRAAQAAQGDMTWMEEVTGKKLRERVGNELNSTARQLRHSRRLTALAIALAALTVFLTIVVEREEDTTTKLLVVSDQLASPACGTPTPGRAGQLTLQPEEDEEAQPIALTAAEIATVTTVEQCP